MKLALLTCLLFIGAQVLHFVLELKSLNLFRIDWYAIMYAQGSVTTTISITISSSGEAIVSTSVPSATPAAAAPDVSSVSGVGGIPTAGEIATIRSSWAMIKDTSDVYVNVMLEYVCYTCTVTVPLYDTFLMVLSFCGTFVQKLKGES